MRSFETIAFCWGHFETFVNDAFELRSGLRRECWGWGKSGSAEFKIFGHVYGNDGSVKVSVYIALGRASVHVPLQEFAGMLINSIRNTIKVSEGERICACWRVALLVQYSVSVPECVPGPICVHNKRMRA